MCHVLVHPSLHDSGGWVCLEAMAAGRPVICLDQGGPGVQVTSHTGIKISVGTPDNVIADIAEAMRKFANDRDLCESMGNFGRQRISSHFGWHHKAQLFNGLYNQISER
jgi:glycosyltransferase involved in cell wall biosynthesis